MSEQTASAAISPKAYVEIQPTGRPDDPDADDTPRPEFVIYEVENGDIDEYTTYGYLAD